MQQELQDGRDDADDRHALRADAFEEAIRVEALVEHHARARVERGDERHNDAVHVMQREHAHHPLIVGQLMPLGDGHPAREKVVVCQRDAFRVARGAGDVYDKRVILRPRLLVGHKTLRLSRELRLIVRKLGRDALTDPNNRCQGGDFLRISRSRCS